jgi:hypothetical protein
VAAILVEYGISDEQVTMELCFILLWIDKETRASDELPNFPGKFHQMWIELDNLKDYLLKNRITSVSFRGEYGKNEPGENSPLRRILI